jgi:hypothetical protein
MTARFGAGFGAIRRWRPQVGSGRTRIIVVSAVVIALASALTMVVTATAAPRGDEVSLTNAQISALEEAAASCPDLRPARLAGQVMAATGFEPTADGGIGGLTAAEWAIWKPWESAQPSDDRASLLALAHLTCDLIGHLRVAGLPRTELWRLAMAAFASSLFDVVTIGGVPAAAAEFVAAAERYTAAYDRYFGTGPNTVPAPNPAGPTTEAGTATATATDEPSTPETVISSSAGSTTPPAITTTTVTAESTTWIYFAGFANANHLVLNGSARVRDNRLDLADGVWANGSAWATTTLPTTRSFKTAFTGVVTGAHDGLAFVIQADGLDALGQGGAGIGYGAADPSAYPPDAVIRPSLVVEFDTADNSSHGWDPAAPQHVAVTLNGDVSKHYVWADPQIDLDNNQPFSAWIEYDAAAHLLTVYVARNDAQPALPLLIHPIDLRAALGTDRAWVGFTAASAVYNNRASVLAWSLISG